MNIISSYLTLLPPPPLTHSPLAEPASITVNILLQLMKATVLAESYCFPCVLSDLSTLQTMNQVCVALFSPFLTYFLSFYHSRFSFYIYIYYDKKCINKEERVRLLLVNTFLIIIPFQVFLLFLYLL